MPTIEERYDAWVEANGERLKTLAFADSLLNELEQQEYQRLRTEWNDLREATHPKDPDCQYDLQVRIRGGMLDMDGIKLDPDDGWRSLCAAYFWADHMNPGQGLPETDHQTGLFPTRSAVDFAYKHWINQILPESAPMGVEIDIRIARIEQKTMTRSTFYQDGIPKKVVEEDPKCMKCPGTMRWDEVGLLFRCDRCGDEFSYRPGPRQAYRK